VNGPPVGIEEFNGYRCNLIRSLLHLCLYPFSFYCISYKNCINMQHGSPQVQLFCNGVVLLYLKWESWSQQG